MPMAKFFLFIFTILLSLSLGLLIGQSHLPPPAQSAALNKINPSDTNVDSTPNLNQKLWELKNHIAMFLASKVDKILANDFFSVDSSQKVLKNMDGAKNKSDHKVLKNLKSDNESKKGLEDQSQDTEVASEPLSSDSSGDTISETSPSLSHKKIEDQSY